MFNRVDFINVYIYLFFLGYYFYCFVKYIIYMYNVIYILNIIVMNRKILCRLFFVVKY